MEQYAITEIGESRVCILPVKELIELLEYKLLCLQRAKSEDSSWNYGIEELSEEIKRLQQY